MANTVYTVPEQYAGKTLTDIRNLTGAPFRPDVLESRLGIGNNARLTKGQTFNLDWSDPGSAEYQMLQNYFGPQSYDTWAQSNQLAAEQQAIQPAVDSLRAGIPIIEQAGAQRLNYLTDQKTNIDQRYQNLLSSLTNKETQSENQIGLNTSREFGKRGISLNSGAYDQALMDKLLPLRSEYSDKYGQVGVAQMADLANINNLIAMNPIEIAKQKQTVNDAIAALQAGAGQDAIANAITMIANQNQYQLGQDTLENDLNIAKLEQGSWG